MTVRKARVADPFWHSFLPSLYEALFPICIYRRLFKIIGFLKSTRCLHFRDKYSMMEEFV
uniref:Uncharacterized protein n=1 Tax=Utricularia reniformis TaxID=192314 RepID=A0A1Y0B456_9LAMI|nr:hypothetical protein AEK19_MT2007 [Utricularia reniformis]ART32167.1 hypothetical protein AEK19_MT2007 [Utricularia reniformis]